MSRIIKTSLSMAGLAAAAGALALTGTLATASHSQPAKPKSEEACFYRRNINGFNAPNEKTVYIRVGVNDIFRLDLMYDCTGLTFRQDIGLEDQPAGDAFICSPMQATVVYRDAGVPQRCPVTAMHKLTKDEIAALPKKDRP